MYKNKEIKAKKSLGQNFLIDKSVLDNIVSAINPKKGETIIEIGPGHGELTEYLVKSGANVIAIEKDTRLAAELKTYDPRLTVIEADAIAELPKLVSYKSLVSGYKLCGNIPYYITGHLFRIISELKNKPREMVFMIQKEVAERICAKKGEMNLLAASIQIWAKPEIVRFVSKDGFNPKPKVDSAVIRLETNDIRQMTPKQMQKYYKLLHVIFKQPRKTIFNNLREATKTGLLRKDSNIEEVMKKNRLKATARPQDLGIEDLKELSEIL